MKVLGESGSSADGSMGWFDRMEQGDFSEADQRLSQAEAGKGTAPTLDFYLLKGAGFLAGLPFGQEPKVEWLTLDPSSVPSAGISRLHSLIARAAFLRMSALELSALSSRVSELIPTDALSAREWFTFGLTHLARGNYDEGYRAGNLCAEYARGQQDAPRVVDGTSLAAWCALEGGQNEDALTLARRASRMARTEALPQQEYFAHLVLARVRRHFGMPHLSGRIVHGLARFAPQPYYAWLDWESLLSTRVLVSDQAGSPASGELAALLGAAQRGQVPEFEGGRQKLRQLAKVIPLVASDVSDTVMLLDPSLSIDALSGEAKAWAVGDRALPPRGLHGLGVPAVGYVFCDQNAVGRRVLGLGGPLCGVDLPAPKARPRERTETGVAALALAPRAGIGELDLFRQLYGFEFDHEKHRGVLDTLIHRMRAELGERGTIDRAEGVLTLRLHQAVLLMDPRTSPPLEERILRAVSTAGWTSARQTAGKLGVPLRTVQRALKGLTLTGACQQKREGNQVVYAVEDTTFSEPTTAGRGT